MDQNLPSERELIRIIKGMIPGGAKGVVRGIGDDCAVLEIAPDRDLLATVDCLVEGVHFSLDYASPSQLGWRAVAVNLSDIASMGGEPRFALISLFLPEGLGGEFVKDFYRGVGEICEAFRCIVVGGNVSLSPASLMIDVALLGEVEKGRGICRGGAQPGDSIFVTGTLGDSSAGMRLLKEGEGAGPLTLAHLRPIPRVREGKILARSGLVTAMIDVSDGLAADLEHICDESGAGAEVAMENIPLSYDLVEQAEGWGANPHDFALYGGEDYELLFTVREEGEEALLTIWDGEEVPITKIGRIVGKEKGLRVVDESGSLIPLPKGGYDHFRRSR